jgi:hypothetical protein
MNDNIEVPNPVFAPLRPWIATTFRSGSTSVGFRLYGALTKAQTAARVHQSAPSIPRRRE